MSKNNQLKVFASPEKYVQGRDATASLGSEMKKLGMKGPVLVVSSETPKRLLEATWTQSLKEGGYTFHYHPFGGICTHDEARRIAKAALDAGKCKTIVAIGGGQVIDAVRTASILAEEEDKDWVSEVVSCPTLASTDAPCSTLCVLYHGDRSFHEYRFTRRHPTLVLVDTAIVAKAPRRMLVGGLGDALATWFEARTIKEACELTFVGGRQTETAAALAKLSYEILIRDGPAAVQAVDTNAVTPALERVIEANTLLSGLGFESGGLCVAHSVHNGLTSQSQCMQYTHGERVAFGLITQLVLEGRPPEELEIVLKFCSTVGLPITLRALSVDADNGNAIKEIAARTLAPGESAHREPFDVTVDMMADAIRGADRMGTLYEKGLKC